MRGSLNKVRRLARKLEKLTPEAVEKIVLRVCKEHEAFAIELNLRQLDAGKDRLGIKFPPYSPAYARKKGRKIPDLKLTGAFWKGFILNAGSFPLTITSKDAKTQKLVERYGTNLFNLSEVNTKKFARHVQPFIVEAIRKAFLV